LFTKNDVALRLITV